MSNGTPPQQLRILVVDDEAVVRNSLEAWFSEDGHSVHKAGDAKEALRVFRESGPYDLAFLDIKMPGMDGLELQDRILSFAPETTVVIMTAYASVKTAVQALKAGAYDYITKPFDPDDLSHLLKRVAEKQSLTRENQELRTRIEQGESGTVILGRSEAIRHVLERIETVAPTTTTVLISGESGVGKELVARGIHTRSPRAFMPLVVVNCGALPEGTLESELFGHERGAFTGAHFRHKGKFELADGGTLFLDEVGELTPRIQVELLRVLEDKQVVRLGGTAPVKADFRLIAATNRDLNEFMRAGKFREDLYYRLRVFPIHVPPLRQRREDIPILVDAFVHRFARLQDRPAARVAPEAMALLADCPWPGNVRELANVIEQAVVVCPGEVILPDHLALEGSEDRDEGEPGPLTLNAVERQHVERILADTDWNISRAARLLNVDRKTVYHKIKEYGLHKES